MRINIVVDENNYINAYNTTNATYVNNIEAEVPKEYVEIVKEKGTFYGTNGTTLELEVPVEKLKEEFTENYDCFKLVDGILQFDENKKLEKEKEQKEKIINNLKRKIVELEKEKEIYIKNEWCTTELENQISKLKSEIEQQQ